MNGLKWFNNFIKADKKFFTTDIQITDEEINSNIIEWSGIGYSLGIDMINVYLNGVHLTKNDYIELTPNSIQYISEERPLISSDIITITYKYTEAEVVNKAVSYNPNLIINGDFQIWQRGNSFTISNNKCYYTADRFAATVSGSATVASITDGISIKPNTDSSSVALKYIFLVKPSIVNTPLTLSFYARATKDLTTSVKILSGANVIKQIDTNITTTDERFNVTFIPPNTNAVSIYIQCIPQNNSGVIEYISKVKLETGEIATNFVPKRFEQELFDCQYYYCYLRTGSGDNSFMSAVAYNSTHGIDICIPLPRQMRVTPNLSIINSSNMYLLYFSQSSNTTKRYAISSRANYRMYNNIFIFNTKLSSTDLSARAYNGSYALYTTGATVTFVFDSELYYTYE